MVCMSPMLARTKHTRDLSASYSVPIVPWYRVFSERWDLPTFWIPIFGLWWLWIARKEYGRNNHVFWCQKVLFDPSLDERSCHSGIHKLKNSVVLSLFKCQRMSTKQTHKINQLPSLAENVPRKPIPPTFRHQKGVHYNVTSDAIDQAEGAVITQNI